MISLKQSLSELDRLESMQKVSLDCYRSAIEAAGRYSVEVDSDTTKKHIAELEEIARRVKSADSSDELVSTRTAFQGQLQQYADQAGHYVRTLRDRLTETSRALSGIVEAIKKTDVTKERKIDANVKRLTALGQLPEIRAVCPDFELIAADLEDGINEMRQRDRVVIAQLRSEIDSLHESLQSARQAATRDAISGVLNRAEALARTRRQLEAGGAFCLVFLWISNFSYIDRRYGSQFRDAVIADFAQRLRNSQPSSAPVGRWSDDRFVILLERSKPEAIWMTETLAEKLSGPYVAKDQDLVREIRLQLKTGVVESPADNTESRLLAAADKMLSAIESVNAPV